MKHGYGHNDGVRLHYLDTGIDSRFEGMPLVILPGVIGRAEDFLDVLDDLRPRRGIAISPRGNGRSDAPTHGYSPADQVHDLEAVLHKLSLRRYALFAYSMNVPTAIATALNNPNAVRGLILGDYPARFPRIPLEWVERVVMDLGSEISAYVPQAIQAASAEHPLWEDLPALTCPVLLLRGDGLGSLLTEEDSAAYLDRLPNARESVLPGAGHALWKPDFDRFMGTLTDFLTELDAANPR